MINEREVVAAGRALYACEAARAKHCADLLGLKTSTMEPWEEVADQYCADARAAIAAIEKERTLAAYANDTAGGHVRPGY